MPCGLFGKLPMKRDFISVDAPRDFLQVWEPWIQGGVAASRIRLGSGWRDAFLSAPIWRFWFGRDICGFPVMGSFMSSVDGVGRFFPLTVMACGDAADAYEPPTIDSQADWFSGVEALLLDTLEENATYDACLEALSALPTPNRVPAPSPDAAISDLFGASVATALSVEELDASMKSLLAERERRLYSRASFWWTIGGGAFAPKSMFSEGLPDPNIVTSLLSGHFEAASG
ncbi:MAG: type VI secretion-associated protein [Rhizobiales bacterium 65-9]|nr:type VI secretion system-associated protein TagF [Hyphomicrobiales bacterium]OJY36747.1 MAG: type VI secretion-associated protein [Rhizobiales bacterium 65-9]